jgi:hypothetical protein
VPGAVKRRSTRVGKDGSSRDDGNKDSEKPTPRYLRDFRRIHPVGSSETFYGHPKMMDTRRLEPRPSVHTFVNRHTSAAVEPLIAACSNSASAVIGATGQDSLDRVHTTLQRNASTKR